MRHLRLLSCWALVAVLLWACSPQPAQEEGFVVTVSDSYSIGAEGGGIEVAFVTNLEPDRFMVTTDSDWLTIADTKAAHKESINLIAEANDSEQARSATVSIITAEKSHSISITQDGYVKPATLKLSQTVLEADAFSCETVIYINSSEEYTAYIDAGADWISAECERNLCKISLAANPGFQMRNGQVLFASGDRQEILSITQNCLQAQQFAVGEGYAGNSVNVTVFRGSSIVSDAAWQFTAWYDAEGTIMVAKRPMDGSGSWETAATDLKGNIADAHNVISLGLDGEGYLHISWNMHGARLHYARSRSPYSSDFEVLDLMVSQELERRVTYPEFRRFSNGDLLFAYRDGSSGNGNLVINRYKTASRNWVRIQDNLLGGEGQRNAYWQMYLDAADNIYLSWVWRETGDVGTNHDLCYAVSHDGGISWQRSDGKPYTLPITIANAEIAWPVPQRCELINQTSMTADAEGHPYIATYWREMSETVPQYRLVYHNGQRWRAVQVGKRSEAFTLAGGGTKSIPISRPHIVSDGNRTMVIFRDNERGSRVSIAGSTDLVHWGIVDVTDDSVDAWEPSFDYERFKRDHILDIFVQRAGQGDGEQTTSTPPQRVRIIEIK